MVERRVLKRPRRRLKIIDPAYDPVARVWFVAGLKVEAPTIKALLALLPDGTRVANYYPLGTTAPRPKYDSTGATRHTYFRLRSG
jgi:hypothetical protein